MVELELGEDVADVGLHRLVGNVEGLGDLVGGAAVGELGEHLPLPLGERLGERAALRTKSVAEGLQTRLERPHASLETAPETLENGT